MVTAPFTPRNDPAIAIGLRGDRKRAVGLWIKDYDDDCPEVVTIHTSACPWDGDDTRCRCKPLILRKGAVA